jgi:hypothetical protein
MSPPRALVLELSNHANWDATTVVVTGKDPDGNTITENFAVPDGGNASVAGSKLFRNVTQVSVPAQSGTNGTFMLGTRAPVTAVATGGTHVVCTAPAGELHSYEVTAGAVDIADETAAPPQTGYTDSARPLPNLPTPPAEGVAPPAQLVTFEVPGFGPLQARFHSVKFTGTHLVLVVDARYGGGVNFPRHSDTLLGVDVAEADRVFSARTTGIEFEVEASRVCVLEVVASAPRAEFEQQARPGPPTMDLPAFPEFDDHGEERRDPRGPDAAGSGHDTVPGF